MPGQYQIEPETSPDNLLPEPLDSSTEVDANGLFDITNAIHLYRQLRDEYNKSITPRIANIERAKSNHPPFWNEQTNAPAELPLYQHNVSSGIFRYVISMVSLTYNSFFPNKSYSRSLLDIELLPDPTDDTSNDPNTLIDRSEYIEKAFDNLIKHSPWAKRAHVQMVSDLMHFDFGMYHFPNKDKIEYVPIDVRKVLFPTGTSIDPDSWEYLYIEEQIPLFTLIKEYKKLTSSNNYSSAWDKDALTELFLTWLSNPTVQHTQGLNNDAISAVDLVRNGLSTSSLLQVAPTHVPTVSLFWRTEDGKVQVRKFFNPTHFTPTRFVYSKDGAYDKFSHAFSVFFMSDEETEIRLARSWGSHCFNLAHAYDRTFCKFLDAIEQAATLFLKINPADLQKKILHLGSMMVGQFEEAKKMPHALEAIIAGLQFLEYKLNQVTFSNGLNRTELKGEGRGAELAHTILTTEGRVHKHLMGRFIESYLRHWREVFRKILYIASQEGALAHNKDIKVRFLDYLNDRGVPPQTLQLDSNSDLNGGLPSSLLISCRMPDGAGITPNISYTAELLGPHLSSLPEDGYKLVLSRIISEAFGDPDMVTKIFPKADLQKLTTEPDLQTAEMQAAILTLNKSDYEFELESSDTIDPKLSDASKFMTLPANRTNDNMVFLEVFLAKVDDVTQRLSRREIGRTTLHIWLYNLVSTAQGHVELLRSDRVRGNRPEVAELFERFGNAFNLLRFVESQANADRQKKLDGLEKRLAEQDSNDPKRIEAAAKLLTARARFSEAQSKFASNRIQSTLEITKNRRAEEAHTLDQGLKLKALREPNVQVPKPNTGRPTT